MSILQLDLVDIFGPQLSDQTSSFRQPVQFIVMEDERTTVFGGLDIALDPVAQPDSGVEGSRTIFQHAIAVQSAMRIWLTLEKCHPARRRTRREQIVEQRPDHSGFTATMASTSTATPSGSDPTPTALRACCPAAPKITSIMSEQPLATLGWPV